MGSGLTLGGRFGRGIKTKTVVVVEGGANIEEWVGQGPYILTVVMLGVLCWLEAADAG